MPARRRQSCGQAALSEFERFAVVKSGLLRPD
jgi:hypothetical protein